MRLPANNYGIFFDKLFLKINIFDKFFEERKKIDFCPDFFFRKTFHTFYVSVLKHFTYFNYRLTKKLTTD